MLLLTRRRFLRQAALATTAVSWSHRIASGAEAGRGSPGHEAKCDVLIVGGSLGGIAAALAVARMGRTAIVTEETAWIGGQLTAQGVPLDEHPWIEQFGATQSYRAFRAGVREHYRRHYPLTPAARADPLLNPGAGWVSALGFEPRAGLAVLHGLLAPQLAAGRVRVLLHHRPAAVAMDGDRVQSVTVHDEHTGATRTLAAPWVIDGTELGDLLALGGIESVVGAESQRETGEPLAVDGPAEPREQMVFTHVFALDHLPGEEHVIDRPREYDFWKQAKSHRGDFPKFTLPDLFGAKHDHLRRPVKPGAYAASTWSFRRLTCRTNFEPGAFPSDLTTAIWPLNEYHLGVLCGGGAEERAHHLAAARQLSRCAIHWLQTEAPNPATGGTGYPGLRPRGDIWGTTDGLAPQPYTRESRRIKAEFTVLEQHFRTDLPETKNGPRKYPDSVGVSGYRVDIHKPTAPGQLSITEAMHGKHWVQQIPLGALIPVRVENLLPACKNLGVTHVTNGAFRVHPTEWNIGEAAGALAAWCHARKLRPREVRNTPRHLADFQRELARQGVELDWPAGFRETARSYYSHHNLELRDADTFYFGEAARLAPPRS
jgi:hypothetical protein